MPDEPPPEAGLKLMPTVMQGVLLATLKVASAAPVATKYSLASET